eukprot:1157512-Pelagomonas_calceolata.AAC.6
MCILVPKFVSSCSVLSHSCTPSIWMRTCACAVEAFQAAGQGDSSSAGSSVGARKRSFNGDAGTTGGGPETGSSQQHQRHHSTGAIAEGEEDEDGEAGVETVGEGPTPQRRRRAGVLQGMHSLHHEQKAVIEIE